MATYEMMKTLITLDKAKGTLNKETWQSKLDVFLMFDRIDADQYQELVELMTKEERQGEQFDRTGTRTAAL